MHFTTGVIALVASISAVSAQGSCTPKSSVDFKFEIATQNVTANASTPITDAKCITNPIITLTGNNGLLADQQGRQGEVVSNNQFQFDVVLQKGRLYDEGFSICTYENGTMHLLHQGCEQFYTCLSGGFSNIYDSAIGDQCTPIWINIVGCAGTTGQVSSFAPISSQGPAKMDGSTATGCSATFAPAASTSASSASTTSTSAAASTSAAPMTSAAATTSVVSTTSAIVAPFPTGNSTMPAGTASAPMTSTTMASTTTSAPATFTAGSGASNLAIGAKLVALAAGIAAFAFA